MVENTNKNDSDDWITYRRLVVETLQRLDERVLALHEKSHENANRIRVIESADFKRLIENVDNGLNDALRDTDNRFNDLQKEVEDIKVSFGSKFGVLKG